MFLYVYFNVFSLGNHQITAIATDSEGNQGQASITIDVFPVQTPYQGVAHAIPGKWSLKIMTTVVMVVLIQMILKGMMVVLVSAQKKMWIEDCTDEGAGYNLGWATAGEWVEYTVDVKNPGTYNLVIRAASENANTISITSDGEELVKGIAIPTTGGWQQWQDVTVKDVVLKQGIQVLRFIIGTDYVNLNYIDFVPISLAIQANNQILNNTSPQTRLFYNQEKQSVFIRIENNGKVEFFDMKGNRVFF